MCDVANAMRYCPDCRRAVTVALDRASGDTVCALCARVLGQRYVDKSSEWRTFLNQVGGVDGRSVGGAGDHSVAHAAAEDAHSKAAGVTVAYAAAEDAHSKAAGVTVAYPAAGDAHSKASGVTVAYPTAGDAHSKAASVTVAYPAAGDAHSKAAGDAETQVGEGPFLGALPRMRGAVGAGTSRGGRGGAPRMRGAVGPVPDRSLTESLHGIDDMAARLELTAAVKDRAKDVLRKLENARAFPRGGKCRNRQALYAACLHVACRAEGTPRTFKELASMTGDGGTAGVKDIGRLVKVMKGHLREEDGGQPAWEMMMIGAVARAGDYLRRFGSLLGMGGQEVGTALEAARRLEKNLDVRHNPDSIAAAVMYMAIERAGAGKSIRDVSTATGVSEGTIREIYYKDLCPHGNMLFGQ